MADHLEECCRNLVIVFEGHLTPERLLGRFRTAEVEAAVWTVVVSGDELLEGIESGSVFLVQVEPLLNLAIALRVVVPAEDVPDVVFREEQFEHVGSLPLFVPFVGVELGSMVSD